MGLHKLTAGDGYTYLTRHVAVHDATEKGHTSLGDYYSERGEAPGRWLGTGLAALDIAVGEDVTASQMKALFGEGRHPKVIPLAETGAAAGGSATPALEASALGRPFAVYQGANEFQTAVAREFSAINAAAGQRWNAPIAAPERARIRTDLGTRKFTDQFGRPPADARELSGFIARASRPSTTAVAGFDLTFSPVKSVSALWAIAPRKISGEIEAAHDAAVTDTLAWLEKNAALTRTGPAGIRQVDTKGLIAAAFTHRDARSGDPDLHTHVAISNKVQTTEGKWLALDGRVLYKANVAASERYNTRLEAELTARLGVRFAERPGGDAGKRAVREIVGVDLRLNAHWSSRRAAIDVRRAELATTFQADHGRPPTAVEAISLAQQATLETRDPKHEPRSHVEQRATWREEAARVLGSHDSVTRMVVTATSPDVFPHREKPGEVTEEAIAEVAVSVLNVVQSSRATWQVWHIRAEAERHARSHNLPLARLQDTVDRIVATALSPAFSIPLGVDDPIAEPDALRRADGSSVYVAAGSKLYTSQAIIYAEQSLLAAARRTDGRTVSGAAVGVALAESAANGLTLTPAQAHLVTQLATSGTRLQLAIAPAGSGKTTAMRALATAWTSGGGTVIGLAPSARAATELRHALGTDSRSDTLAKFTHSLTTTLPPAWVDGIGPSTLVIVDEAGMADTLDLAAAVTHILDEGGSVRLVGDDQQLASVAAGGVLRDIADEVGAATLTELHRFADPAEAAATLALREGDLAAIGFYLDNNRVHVGDLAAVTDHAYEAWASDRAAGRDAVMLAPTRQLVTALNARARADRLAALPGPGPEATLGDGARASAGDVIITRRNDRHLSISETDWVKNGDRWQVRDVPPSGAVVATHLETRRTITLPTEYVRDHVELGYATTVHGAQGSTADISHLIATGAESRQLLYVGMTRARLANHVYLATAADGDPHSVIRPETVRPPTAADILAAILARDDTQESAATTARRLDDPATLLHEAVTRYHDALTVAAEQVLGADALTAIDTAADAAHPGLTDAPAYPTLRSHLALLAVDGTDPTAALRAVTGPGTPGLGTARDAAAVLDWRLSKPHPLPSPSPVLPWLPPTPAALTENTQWGSYLQARLDRIIDLQTQVRDCAAAWTPATAPTWALPHLDPARTLLLGDLAVWRAATGVADDDPRPTGSPPSGAAAARHQQSLDARVPTALGDPQQAFNLWGPVVTRIEPRVSLDPFWPELASRLTEIAATGIDIDRLLSSAIGERPLPDEYPAAALWWRLVREVATTDLHAAGGARDELRSSKWPRDAEAIQRRPDDFVLAPVDISVAGAETDHDAKESSPVEDPDNSDVATHDAFALAIRTATLLRGPLEPTEAEQWAALDEEHKWATADVPRDRLIELNNQAAGFFAARYSQSWAPEDLSDRLGTDLTGDDRFTPGYAPRSWTALTSYLHQQGGTDDEIIAAGLGRVASTGRVIDQFRDRLMFSIQGQDGEIHGFIGRRNPCHDNPTDGSVRSAGPKYLNTPATDLFDKSAQLFGYHEAHVALSNGAVPVLVEGPLDAIAITLASRGKHVGVAALGTAFGDTHANQLVPHIGQAGIIVATDADAAGWKAAQRAYWHLAIRGDNPNYIAMPEGMDPAEILKTGGPGLLQHLLIDRRPLARILINQTLGYDNGPTSTDPQTAISEIATIIAALPPQAWTAHLSYAAERFAIKPDALERAVIDAARAWNADPRGMARPQIQASSRSLPQAPAAHTSPYLVNRASTDHLIAASNPVAEQSWHQLPLPARTRGPVHPDGPTP